MHSRYFIQVGKSKGETELYHTYSPTSSLLLSAFYQVKASASYTSSSEMNLIFTLMSRFQPTRRLRALSSRCPVVGPHRRVGSARVDTASQSTSLSLQRRFFQNGMLSPSSVSAIRTFYGR